MCIRDSYKSCHTLFSLADALKEVEIFLLPCSREGNHLHGGEAAAHLTEGRGRSWPLCPSLHASSPFLQRMCRSLKWCVNLKSSQYLKQCLASRLPCLQEPHLHLSMASQHWEKFKGSWHEDEGPWKSHSCVVWTLCPLTFAREIAPHMTNYPTVICFCGNLAASQNILQRMEPPIFWWDDENEKEAITVPISPRKSNLGVLFLSM